MKFNEICLDAEMTRDEIYGLNVGNGETIFYTQEDDLFKQEQESEYRRLKRIKQENIENYRKQVDATGEFQYNGHTDEISLHSNQQAFVGAMAQEGLIEFDDKFQSDNQQAYTVASTKQDHWINQKLLEL